MRDKGVGVRWRMGDGEGMSAKKDGIRGGGMGMQGCRRRQKVVARACASLQAGKEEGGYLLYDACLPRVHARTHARCTNCLHARIQQKHTRARRYNIFHPSPPTIMSLQLSSLPLSLSPPPPRSSSVRASPPLTAPGVDFPATYSPSLLRVFILGDKLVKSLVCVRVV